MNFLCLASKIIFRCGWSSEINAWEGALMPKDCEVMPWQQSMDDDNE